METATAGQRLAARLFVCKRRLGFARRCRGLPWAPPQQEEQRKNPGLCKGLILRRWLDLRAAFDGHYSVFDTVQCLWLLSGYRAVYTDRIRQWHVDYHNEIVRGPEASVTVAPLLTVTCAR